MKREERVVLACDAAKHIMAATQKSDRQKRIIRFLMHLIREVDDQAQKTSKH